MTQEEKAKRYDEALKAAIVASKDEDRHLKATLERIFPELKESEDEKIMKELLNHLKEASHGNTLVVSTLDYKRWADWLEKQGEQKLYVNDNAKEMFIMALERVEEQNNKGYKLTDCDKNSWWEDFKAYTSCTIEQKPADEVEPKFKVGDVIKPKDPVLGEPRIIKGIHPKFGYDTNNGILDFEFEDNWELVEEPVSEEWIEELRTKLDSLSKEDFKKVFDKYAIDFNEEPVSEDLEKIVEEIAEPTILNAYGTKELARRLRNTICGISISENLDEYINELSKQFPEVSFAKLSRIAVRVAKWQKENLWKPADGDDLPEIDREVIALLDNGKVVFAHRPPEYWDGKNIITGEVTRYYPKTYDKGGWNIPNIKYWLDCLMPKEIEL